MLPKQCNTAEEQAQTRRDDYRGKQCTTWVGMTLPSAPRHLLASALLLEMAQRFGVSHHGSRSNSYTRHCTRYGTLHLLRDATPLTGRCTRSERVHCLRIGCSTHIHKHNRGPNRAVS